MSFHVSAEELREIGEIEPFGTAMENLPEWQSSEQQTIGVTVTVVEPGPGPEPGPEPEPEPGPEPEPEPGRGPGTPPPPPGRETPPPPPKKRRPPGRCPPGLRARTISKRALDKRAH